MSLPDTIFIFALALVIFGPKKLPEIGRQIGKLVFEFRRASNEFKMQIEEELRAAEQADRQKKLAAENAVQTVPAATVTQTLTARPPSTGATVSTESPRVVPQDEEAATLEAVLPRNEISGAATEGTEQPLAVKDAFDAAAGLSKALAELQVPEQTTASGAPVSSETHAPAAVSEPEGDVPLGSASTVMATPVAGAQSEAARLAEEHIQEQIAIHHG